MRITEFDGDAFISYAHLDNIELVEGRKGWVANLHRALEIRVAQLLGKEARIWWDPKLQGNDYFAMTLVDQLQRVAALVAVVSPRYVRSEWGRKEIEAFCRAAEEQGGLRIRDKARIFKVLKTPVPLEHQLPELQALLGYEFFKVDPETGKVRELDEVFGPEAQREFWLKLDDLAHDICLLLNMLDPEPLPGGEPDKGRVYLALTTADMNDEREALRRDLEQHGYNVLPDRPLPIEANDLERMVREDLARCCMSIHMVGAVSSLIPEGAEVSVEEIQNELALERAQQGTPFAHLVWLGPNLATRDERQRKFVERLRMDERCPAGTDLLETPLEDLRTVVDTRLKRLEKSVQPGPSPTPDIPASQLYLLYDSRDASAVGPWAEFLFSHGEVIHPAFDGSEADLREYHAENLCSCDGVLVFYGAGNELWLRGKLREIQKSPGYGRVKPLPVVGICMIPPKTAEKDRFRTHHAIVVPQWGGLEQAALEPFLIRLRAAGSRPEHATGTSD